MSEKHIPQKEHHEKATHHESNEHQERAHKHIEQQAERARIEKSNENLDKIRELAEAEAQNSVNLATEENSPSEPEPVIGLQHSLKATSYKKTLAKTQKKLSPVVRSFSKFTHNSSVEKISAVTGATIARPSGFLTGSIFAFLGSATLYYFSKHYGFKYNYLLLVIFFIGGYLVGSLLEMILWFLYYRKQRY